MSNAQEDVSVVVTPLTRSVLVASSCEMWGIGPEQAEFAGLDFDDVDLLFEAALAATSTPEGRRELVVPHRLLTACRLLPVSCLALLVPDDRYPRTEHTAAEFYAAQVEIDGVLDELGVPVVLAGGVPAPDPARSAVTAADRLPRVAARPVGDDAAPVRLRRTTGIALAATAVEVAAVGADAEEFLGAAWPAVRQVLLRVRGATPVPGGTDVELSVSAAQCEVLRRLPLSYLAFVDPEERAARSGLSAADLHAAHVDVHRALPPAPPAG